MNVNTDVLDVLFGKLLYIEGHIPFGRLDGSLTEHAATVEEAARYIDLYQHRAHEPDGGPATGVVELATDQSVPIRSLGDGLRSVAQKIKYSLALSSEDGALIKHARRELEKARSIAGERWVRTEGMSR